MSLLELQVSDNLPKQSRIKVTLKSDGVPENPHRYVAGFGSSTLVRCFLKSLIGYIFMGMLNTAMALPITSITLNSPVSSEYALRVTFSGTGYGTVVASSGNNSTSFVHQADPNNSDTTGIVYSGVYTSGSTLILTATPDSGNSFTGWGGACSGTSSTCTITMLAESTVTATFTKSTTNTNNTSTTDASALNAGTPYVSLYTGGVQMTLPFVTTEDGSQYDVVIRSTSNANEYEVISIASVTSPGLPSAEFNTANSILSVPSIHFNNKGYSGKFRAISTSPIRLRLETVAENNPKLSTYTTQSGTPGFILTFDGVDGSQDNIIALLDSTGTYLSRIVTQDNEGNRSVTELNALGYPTKTILSNGYSLIYSNITSTSYTVTLTNEAGVVVSSSTTSGTLTPITRSRTTRGAAEISEEMNSVLKAGLKNYGAVLCTGGFAGVGYLIGNLPGAVLGGLVAKKFCVNYFANQQAQANDALLDATFDTVESCTPDSLADGCPKSHEELYEIETYQPSTTPSATDPITTTPTDSSTPPDTTNPPATNLGACSLDAYAQYLPLSKIQCASAYAKFREAGCYPNPACAICPSLNTEYTTVCR